jgi:hypothetical protein
MARSRFRFPDSSPSYTPEFPQGAALNHEPTALPLSYRGLRTSSLVHRARRPVVVEASRAHSSALQPRDFLKRIPHAVKLGVPPALASFHSTTRFSLTKVWYGNADIHYEVDLRARARSLELGLHFESDALTNARLLSAFKAHERRIHKALGGDVRVEEWDRGWARVWESCSFAALDDELLAAVAGRCAAYIVALEPIVLAELPGDVEWSEPKRRR